VRYIAALGVAAFAVATGSAAASASSPAKPKSSTVPLVVYSAQGYDHAEVTAFSNATHIPVRLDDNSTGPLLTQIEASRNNPNWGLLWVDGATAFAELDKQGLLLKELLGTAQPPLRQELRADGRDAHGGARLRLFKGL
jgi:iron(III) transport system substrate-binding protein